MKPQEFLKKILAVEKTGRVACRIMMIIVFFACGEIFVEAARMTMYDRRTISTWYHRYVECKKSFKGIRMALSDRPRSGRPTKVSKKHLNEARKWCKGRVFSPFELRDKIEDLSGVRLSMQQVRRYARKWGHSRKKSEPIRVKRATLNSVRCWRRRMLKRIAKYVDKEVPIVTMDEAHFKDGRMSTRFWTTIGKRILMPWAGGHHEFSMFCSMTMDGRVFLNHSKSANEDSFLEHLKQVYSEVGRMVLVLDKASYHKSTKVRKFLRNKKIVLIWYPTGHPYLDPVEEVWNTIRREIESSVYYANKKDHLEAIYDFVEKRKFNYDFVEFWKRSPPKGFMRPFNKGDPERKSNVESHLISCESTPKP